MEATTASTSAPTSASTNVKTVGRKKILKTAILTTLTIASTSVGLVSFAQAQPDSDEIAARSGIRFQPYPLVLEPKAGDGCWVRLFDGHNFKERNVEIIGPKVIDGMELPNGVDWRKQTDSLEVGRRANVTIFTGPARSGRSLKLGPAERQTNIENELGDEPIESLRVDCLAPNETDD